MRKINLYVFIQIIKSCTLVFFIFVSIAWLLQISRLFTFLNNFQVKFIETFYLSFFLIPNLINVILPFIMIFGFVIAFIKLDRDKEIIALFSLGLSINEIKKPITYFLLIISIFYLILNFFLSPFVYDLYKEKEYNLRNSIDLQEINISNFIEINEDIILDFTKENNKFKDVFIILKKNNENMIFASEATISNTDGNLNFNLINGFKIEFINEKIEKLEFTNYKFDIPIGKNIGHDNVDNNTLTIFDLLNKRNYSLIIEKFIDSFLIITIIILFYYDNIKKNSFKLRAIFSFIFVSICILVFHNLIKNIEIQGILSLILSSINIGIVFFYIILKKI